jgi:nitrite reductase (NADH) large subunit
MKRIVIIGNGVAGIFTAQYIRNRDKDSQIHVYSDEKYDYYTRIKLPELISEEKTIEDLIVFKEEWYENNKIESFLDKKVTKLHPDQKQISIKGEDKLIDYDKLVLATGSLPNIPPIDNAREMEGKGLFTLRNIDDALEIKQYVNENDCKKAIIIGGGLLGLELAKQIKITGLDTRVVEYFPRLLPRQLDTDCGNMLKEEITNMGIEVELDAKTQKVLANDSGSVRGILLERGEEYPADIILVQAGVHPKIDLAKEAGLKTNKGIIIDEYLETSVKDIYAVGDCIEYKGDTWGIIPACMEQSKIAAASIAGKEKKEYTGTTPQTTLKIVGIDLTSVGVYNPSEELGGGWEILKKADKKNNCYQKIVLKGNKLKGAILFGDKSKEAVPYVRKNIESEVEEKKLRELIDAHIYECPNCHNKYDEAKKGEDFEELSEDWSCECGTPKSEFKKIE